MTSIMDWKEETEKRVQKGVAFFKQGYNCSQSVTLAFADRYNVPLGLMARISASFGGGIGRMRETCGSACGMFLLAGLEEVSPEQVLREKPEEQGQVLREKPEEQEQVLQEMPKEQEQVQGEMIPYDQQVKAHNYKVVQQLAADFKAETGSLICRELLSGYVKNVNTNPTPDARTDEYYKKRPCVKMVELAIRTYMKYLEQKNKNKYSRQ